MAVGELRWVLGEWKRVAAAGRASGGTVGESRDGCRREQRRVLGRVPVGA